MIRHIEKRRSGFAYRLLSAFIAFTFSWTSILPPGYAQVLPQTFLNLPVPGAMVTPTPAFVPVLLKGITIDPGNPLQFDFIVDTGNSGLGVGNADLRSLQEESEKLVKYFLASMTIPKDDLWVNLSPYESDKIIPEELGKTDLGRDMLAQDYILKQLTASLMYPEKELGKEFWARVYKLAQEKYGTSEIPVNTFNKVWILPETATVYEHGQTVYIVEARLRVMLDADYQAREASLVKSEANNDSGYASRNTNDEDVGGIDMNAIDLERRGAGVDIQFDPAELQELIDAGIDGFAPVIINITPLPSVLPLLGLEPRREEDAERI